MTPIYMDYNASTPVDPRVVQALTPYLKEFFGNPSSASHSWGWAAEQAVEKSRAQIAELLDCDPLEITFTSGSTESNNWALKGLIEQMRIHSALESHQESIHVLSSAAEHNSVLRPLEQLQKLFPIEVEFLPVNSEGQVTVEQVKKAIRKNTKLMSFIWVNNEIGTINDVEKLAVLAHDHSIYFHTDATQAIGKIPVSLKNTAIDLLSFSGHKIYAPKGIGALYHRRRNPVVHLQPLFSGGGQERGHRSGTLNVPGIVGLGEACRILKEDMREEIPRLLRLQNLLWIELLKVWPEARLNGSPFSSNAQIFTSPTRAPNNVSITFPRPFQSGGLQDPHLGVSAGSACQTGSMNVSHVLRALGLQDAEAARTLRLSLGRWTKESEIHEAVARLRQAMT